MQHLHGIFNFETYDFDYVTHIENNSNSLIQEDEIENIDEHKNQTYLEF